MKNKETGDCLKVAGDFAINIPFEDPKGFLERNAKVCHGWVIGQGALKGVNYVHAWIELFGKVIDKSNGNNVSLDIGDYYKLGNITDIKKYSLKSAREKMIETGHYGPWK